MPLILASSKTAAEIAPLHAGLGLGDAPAIVENGAGLYEPGQTLNRSDDYRQIRHALDALPAELRGLFTGFGDMSVPEVVAATGLSAPAAELARDRMFSEPGQFAGDAAAEQAFIAALSEVGIHARRGGRFLTLSLGFTKADAMAAVTARYGRPTTLALGDAPNDTEMLQSADFGVIVRNDHGTGLPPLAGEETGRIQRTDLPGPEGWNLAVLNLLSKLSLS